MPSEQPATERLRHAVDDPATFLSSLRTASRFSSATCWAGEGTSPKVPFSQNYLSPKITFLPKLPFSQNYLSPKITFLPK